MTQKEKKIAANKQWLWDNAKYITRKDYEAALTAATKARDKVPAAHRRIRERTYNDVLIDAIRGTKRRKAGKPVTLLAVGRKELTSWPNRYAIDELRELPADGVDYCAKTIVGWTRYYYSDVIAIIKA